MSELFPERPVLFYPSLALRYGADEALLLSILDELFRQQALAEGGVDTLLLAPSQCQMLAPFWPAARFSVTLGSLERQGLIQAQQGHNGTLRIQRRQAAVPNAVPAAEAVSVSKPEPGPEPRPASLPVYDTPPPSPAPAPGRTRGPAPMFGGNAGWRRGKNELEQIFDWHEERNQRLMPMTMGWQPGEAFHDMLSRQAIPSEFAQQCLDEFVLYWLDKDRKETNWDQKFLAWVKREWVRKQSRDSAGRSEEQQPLGQLNENTRRDTRENRKRVTAAIMDIKDTDW